MEHHRLRHEHLATSQDGRRGQFGDDQEHAASGLLRRRIERALRGDAILTIPASSRCSKPEATEEGTRRCIARRVDGAMFSLRDCKITDHAASARGSGASLNLVSATRSLLEL